MSYDELPPESSQPEPVEPTAADPTREASSSDAPPAAPARPRRARSAKSVAAPKNTDPVPDAKPKRTTRKRTTEPATPSIEASSPAAPEPTTAQEETPAPAASKPTRARRSRKTAETVAEAPAVEAPTSAPAETPAPEATPAEAKPARAPRRSRRKTVEAPSAEVETPAAEAEPAETQAVAAPVEPSAEPASPRRRRSRGRKSAEPPPEAPTSSETASASPEAATAELAPERAGRRRTSRSRRKTTETTEATAPPETAPASETPETPDADDASGATRSRRRRDRRSRRRGGQSATEEATATETPTAEWEAPAEPVVAKVAPKIVEVLPPIDRSVGAHLIPRNGTPTIHVNGTPLAPVLFFGNMEGGANRQRVLSQIRRAAKAGVHLHSMLIELPCPLTEASHTLDVFTDYIRAALDADPEGYVMPRLVFTPARGWQREYPTDIAVYADGTTGDPSLTSERFWQEAERSLEMLLAHVHDHAWGQRVIGYHLERGEWFQPAQQGYDRSVANRDAFRDWLREKYRHNIVALRAAWYDGNVQFHTAEIPPLQTKPTPNRAFYETRRERRYIDFNEFTSETTAKRLTALAKTVKKAAEYQVLVSVCYGYTFEFGHPFSGHLALGELMASPYIDLICGPPSYRDRKPGGAASLPAPVQSPPLYGKLWLTEDDTKTYLAPADQDPEDFNPRLSDRHLTEQAHARALGRAYATETGIGFMDLWGEGWLDDDALWEKIGGVVQRALQLQQANASAPEVIALIDEKSLLHVQRGEPFFRKLSNGLRDLLQRAGVSYGTYLQSDLLSEKFPTNAKLYLFLTPYRLTQEQRHAVKEKLQQGGKTLAWLYAPGSCEERPGLGGGMDEAVTDAVGIELRHQEWNSEVGSRIIEPHHPLTQTLAVRELGARERLNPSFYVDDPDSVTLAEYQGSGLPSIAARDFKTWKSVFIGEPTLTLELLRGLCRYAGAHLWASQGEDIVSVGNGWATIHAARDGNRVLHLPESLCLYDLTERKMAGQNVKEHRYFQRGGTTKIFLTGTRSLFEKLGLPLAAPAPPRPRPEPSVAPPPPPTGNVPLVVKYPSLENAPESIRADLETLHAVLNMSLEELEAAPIPADEAETEALNEDADGLEAGEDGTGRRRRRRGGRGRGRRRFGSITETHAEIAAPEGSPLPLEGEAPLPAFPLTPEDDFPDIL